MQMDRVPFALCASARLSDCRSRPGALRRSHLQTALLRLSRSTRFPHPSAPALQKMPALRILRAMNSGAMMTVAYPLRREERETVAAYLGTPGPEPGPKPEAFCKERAISLKQIPQFSWNGWSPTLDNARFQSSRAKPGSPSARCANSNSNGLSDWTATSPLTLSPPWWTGTSSWAARPA